MTEHQDSDQKTDARIAALRVDVLEAYEGLSKNIKEMSAAILDLNKHEVTQLTTQLREIERRFGLVYTLFRSSIYDVILREQGDVGAQQNPFEMDTNRPAFN